MWECPAAVISALGTALASIIIAAAGLVKAYMADTSKAHMAKRLDALEAAYALSRSNGRAH